MWNEEFGMIEKFTPRRKAAKLRISILALKDIHGNVPQDLHIRHFNPIPCYGSRYVGNNRAPRSQKDGPQISQIFSDFLFFTPRRKAAKLGDIHHRIKRHP
jgi:hypothetical protein